jgi:hypothetical protein
MDESERRRLSEVPDDWSSLPPARLAELCAVANPVTPSRGTVRHSRDAEVDSRQ